MINRKALIFGATGAVGRQLLKLCLEGDRYHKVTVIARSASSFEHDKLNWLVVDFEGLDSLAAISALNDADAFCCLGTTNKAAGSRDKFRRVDFDYVLSAAKFANKCQVSRFSMVSAIGANKASSNFYSQTKGAVEEAVSAEGMGSLRIFRPSLLKGKRDEFRLMESLSNTLSLLLAPLFYVAFREYKPIAIDKLARALYLTADQNNEVSVRIYESDELQAY